MDYNQWKSHLDVSRETFDKLSAYHDLLLKWQSKINLISPNTINDIWHRHILDSAQFYRQLPDTSIKLVDIGSGAGLPGIILSIMGINEVHSIESDGRKCLFQKEVARQLNLPMTIHNSRIEETTLDSADVITARACSSLSTLLTWSKNLRSEKTICLFAKGKNYAKDLDEAKMNWSFDYNIIPSITDDQAAILALKNIHQ